MAESLEELTKRNVETISRLEKETVNEGAIDRLADHVTQFSGSVWFLVMNMAVFGSWVAVNLIMHPPFDPFPFSLLTLFLSIEAILLSIFILMSERRQAILDERRSKLDLQVNLLAEQENTKMLHLLIAIAKKLEIDVRDDATLKALEEATDPGRIAEQMDKAIKK